MFKKLQRTFMVVSSLVLLLVISLVLCVAYWITTSTVMSQTEVIMELILDNDGDLPDQSAFNASQETFLALNQESIHESRFFCAEIADESVALVNMHLFGLSDEEAVAMAERAFAGRRSFGRMSASHDRVMHYLRRVDENGDGLVVFLDSTSRYGLVWLIVMYMAALWLTVLLLYVFVMGHYSRKVVQPFIENDERQKRFITNASHELKTPLAVISANTEMTEVMGGKSKWTESTRRQVKRLQTLIEDLVVLTRLDEMKDIELKDVDLSAAVRDVVEPFRSVVEGSGRTFACEIAPDIRVRGDRRSLAQVTSILMDNAAKYCDEGGAVAVSLTKKPRGRAARLVVSNTYKEGKNVDFSRFFERFYRQDESHNSEKSGFGIGLSMAKEIVERMKGKIRVEYSKDTIRFVMEL